MTVLLIMVGAVIVLGGAGQLYSRFIARKIGEDPGRSTPALRKADGRDFVPTPTPVVFAHHFASIAGAGPIVGPVVAFVYGWLPAVLWVVFGGVFIGAVHDYLATYMATREGGQSVATIARRMLGKDAFVALTIFLVVILALVCAAFLNLSASALTSMLPFDRLELPRDQNLFRVVTEGGSERVVIGGIASMSVVCITAVAPLLGYLYLKRKVAVWKCSLLAIAVCAGSITVGLFWPIKLGPLAWQLLLSGYVLVAAGVPVWIFLQSRDFINVHVLYVGMAILLVTLVMVGIKGETVSDPVPALNVSEGTEALGMFWPTLFIVIACGAVSGFHSLCAGGTTCKQLTSELAARRVGYNAMLLESFLAVCVIGVLIVGAGKVNYLFDVHPKYASAAYPVRFGALNLGAVPKANWVLGFAMAVGNATKLAFGVPIVVGALGGMVLLEGFLVTTLDTAIRLTRYLLEEIWRTLFGKYDVFAAPVAQAETEAEWATGEAVPAGSDGIPVAPDMSESPPAPAHPRKTTGLVRAILSLMRTYWFNSALAVGLMLAFAWTGGQAALWKIFATSNQLLAAMVLSLAALWLLRRGRQFWFALVPAVLMLVTTGTSLGILLSKYLSGFITYVKARMQDPSTTVDNPITLLIADVVIILITAYLLFAGVREVLKLRRTGRGKPARAET